MKKLILILPLLYYSCTDDIVADIDAIQTENAEQDAQIDSLLTVLTEQQVYTDSLNTVQNTLNADQQAYIDSLNGVQQTLIDALISTQPSTGENYVRIDSVQICWGQGSANNSGTILNFPKSFIEVPFVTATIINEIHSQPLSVTNIQTNSAIFITNSPIDKSFLYHAIGRWK